jgi:archaeal type IV pilus assembly protein PilA
MNFEKVRKQKRKAISPVLATVILIAITLIAAVAIAGFVFGLFGSFTSSATIQGAGSYLQANAGGNTAPIVITCAAGVDPGTADSFDLHNSGTANAAISSITLTYGGSSYTAAPAGVTSVTAGGDLTCVVTNYVGVSSAGEAWTGNVVFNSGQAAISGTFS